MGGVKPYILDGCVLRFRLDGLGRAADDTVFDLSGHQNQGSFVGTGGRPVDGGMTFDADSSDAISVSDAAMLIPEAGDFQIHVWANLAEAQNNAIASLVAKGASADGWLFGIKDDDLYFTWCDADCNSLLDVADDTTHLLSAIRASGVLKLYVDCDEKVSADMAGVSLDGSDALEVGDMSTATNQAGIVGTIYGVVFATATKDSSQAELDMKALYGRGAYVI